MSQETELPPKAVSVVRVANGYAVYAGRETCGYDVSTDGRMLPIAVFETNKALVQWMAGWTERLT